MNNQRPSLKRPSLTAIAFFALTALTPSSYAYAWDYRSCAATMGIVGVIIGGATVVILNVLDGGAELRKQYAAKTVARSGATSASNNGTDAIFQDISMRANLGGMLGDRIAPLVCPDHLPMPHDQSVSLASVVESCRSGYYNYLNPVPFSSDMDFCTVVPNVFIRSHDEARMEGYQMNLWGFLAKLLLQFEAGLAMDAFYAGFRATAEKFAGQISECIESYSERFALDESDSCSVTMAETAWYWAIGGNESNTDSKISVSVPDVLETALWIIRASEQLQPASRRNAGLES